MTIDEARNSIGRQVIYRPHPQAPAEQGVITSASTTFVFVRYDGDRYAKGTAPSMLSLAVGGAS